MALRPQHVAPEILNKVTKALGITALDQWYYVSQYAATRVIGSRVLNQFGGSLSIFLKHAYPQHNFDEEKLAPSISLEKDQKFLEVIIRQLFPNEEIHTKARKSVGITNPETGAYLEIDFWIASLKLGIEYQDKHHFGYQWYAHDTLKDYQKRDDIKKDTMSKLGYTLITFGSWWDKTIESLATTIRKVRPDLLKQYEHSTVEPIQPDPPQGYIDESPVIPGADGIMSPFIPTANFDPTNWYAGEKHDGIRGVFNPSLHKMFSRSGNELSILPSLLNDIPSMLVEGEIVAGRGNYAKTAVVSYHSHHDKVNWPMFRYVLYDIPDAELGNYTERYSAIASGLSTRSFIFAQSVFRMLIITKDHLKMLVDTIISDSGEGVIAQQDAQYEYGRSKGLAKIKVRRDADAQVLQLNKLSCTCKLVSGPTAEIEFSQDFNPSELNTGDIVSYYFNGYSKRGMPKQAEIYKVRYDVTWEQLIGENDQTATKQRSVKETVGSRSLIPNKTMKNKMGHWTKVSNVRAFFDEFAQTAGFDPLVPGNWYLVKMRDLQSAKGGGLLHAYEYNRKKALSYAYPELKFEGKKFRTCEKPQVRTKWGHWKKPANVREFFDEFAKTTGFDPLVPGNWYSITLNNLTNAGGGGLLKAFSNTIKKALTSAYPELKFESKKFRTHEKPQVANKWGHWTKAPNVRAFLDTFASTAGFDPLVADNWYTVRISTIQKAGGGSLLKAYSTNLKNALSHAYPELTLKDQFIKREKPLAKNKRGHWTQHSNVRAFFDEVARNEGFDPLNPENWYTVLVSDVINAGGSGLLGAHDHLASAISSAYPELKLDPERFVTHATRGRWNKSSNVRAFFDQFAQTSGFDPLVPQNWSRVRHSSLQISKGSGLLQAYDYDIKKALSSAYPELQFS